MQVINAYLTTMVVIYSVTATTKIKTETKTQ